MSQPDYKTIIEKLKKLYPNPKTPLKHSSAWELLVAVILSAQCTDERVNMVTPKLFAKYKNIEDFANADVIELEKDIKSTGFYRNKARSLIESAKKIISNYDGKVPDTMEELITLRGVARKTANVVLNEWFNKPEGFVVDTHVKRLAKRLGFTKHDNPEKIEQDMMQIVDKKDWKDFSLALVFHGRKVCKARKPNCKDCTICKECVSCMRVD